MNPYSTDESRKIWEANAEFWDASMGNESNEFHRETVRPNVSELLDVKPGDYILDAACGNGNYSAWIAEKGAKAVAFDYSSNMIKLAEKRWSQYRDSIRFCVADATKEPELMALKQDMPFTKAVSNMAVMDIADITCLFRCINRLIKMGGIFVFATQHPCFVTLTDKYLTPHSYKDVAIEGQPLKQCYYHRSLQDILNLCFQNGFAVDGFFEESFRHKEKPDIIIVRAVKCREL